MYGGDVRHPGAIPASESPGQRCAGLTPGPDSDFEWMCVAVTHLPVCSGSAVRSARSYARHVRVPSPGFLLPSRSCCDPTSSRDPSPGTPPRSPLRSAHFGVGHRARPARARFIEQPVQARRTGSARASSWTAPPALRRCAADPRLQLRRSSSVSTTSTTPGPRSPRGTRTTASEPTPQGTSANARIRHAMTNQSGHAGPASCVLDATFHGSPPESQPTDPPDVDDPVAPPAQGGALHPPGPGAAVG